MAKILLVILVLVLAIVFILALPWNTDQTQEHYQPTNVDHITYL